MTVNVIKKNEFFGDSISKLCTSIFYEDKRDKFGYILMYTVSSVVFVLFYSPASKSTAKYDVNFSRNSSLEILISLSAVGSIIYTESGVICFIQ